MQTEKNIYFDFAATTPMDDRVYNIMIDTMKHEYGNPASRSHSFGWRAEGLVEKSREQVANLIGASSKEIVWTSGATESDNLAIKGVAHFYNRKGKHIITSKIEHKAVLDTCRQLEREGYEVTYLTPNESGLIELSQIKEACREDTILVSMMYVNNEIGTIQPISEIGAFLRSKNILLHVDAAQAVGKLPINVDEMNIDLLSISGHKIYGPKGIGALYVRRKPRVRIEAQMHGGGHERGMRSGTLATHQIVGLGEACAIAQAQMNQDFEHMTALRKHFIEGLKGIEALTFNGNEAHQLPHILNFSLSFVEGESLIMGLKEFAISSGSACTSASLEPSYVLKALGLSDELAHSSLRFSFGRTTTTEEVDYAVDAIHKVVNRLRDMSPLWEMHKEGIDINQVEWAHH